MVSGTPGRIRPVIQPLAPARKMHKWRARGDLNSRPSASEADVLSAELRALNEVQNFNFANRISPPSCKAVIVIISESYYSA